MGLTGVGIGDGVVAGPVLRMPEPPQPPARARPGEAATEAGTEIAAARAALTRTAEQLTALAESGPPPARAMLHAAAMMAADPELLRDITARITAGAAADRAVHEAFAKFETGLRSTGGVIGERAADLADVAQRTLANLQGVPAPEVPPSETPFVLVARELAPAVAAALDPHRVLAVVTAEGGPTSHIAIVARSLGIPAVLAVEGAAELAEGTMVIVDASSGTIAVDPGEAALAAVRSPGARASFAASAGHAPGALADGHRLPLLANLASARDAHDAVRLGAEGVGLLRTELLFGRPGSPPTIAEQAERYRELLAGFAGLPVVARVFDAGSDKPLPFLDTGAEPNPALGRRGLRALLASPQGQQVLADQLAALAQAQQATDARLQVMAPMATDAAEAAWFTALAREHGLSGGVMAEVPALALTAEAVFAECDFVSIGTNDLVQYTLAADRQAGALAGYQDPWHPAVLRLVKLICDAGAAAAKPVGVCGEAAADPTYAVVLAGLGATSLSMAPSALAAVRAGLSHVTLAAAREKATAALRATDAAGARAAAS